MSLRTGRACRPLHGADFLRRPYRVDISCSIFIVILLLMGPDCRFRTRCTPRTGSAPVTSGYDPVLY